MSPVAASSLELIDDEISVKFCTAEAEVTVTSDVVVVDESKASYTNT